MAKHLAALMFQQLHHLGAPALTHTVISVLAEHTIMRLARGKHCSDSGRWLLGYCSEPGV